jgi:hypothetical protein
LLKILRTRTLTPPRWDPFRGDANSYYSMTPIPTPISTLFVQNEDCSRTTRGGEAEDIRHAGKNYQAWYLTGVSTEHTSPPIRDGVPHTPKLIPHDPPLPTGTSSSFSLTTKKNGENRGRRLSQSISTTNHRFGLRLPTYFFSNG